MCEGEYESLKAIYAISPSFVPEPYAWGKYKDEAYPTYFLLAQFRDVGEQVRVHSLVEYRVRGLSLSQTTIRLSLDHRS
jgi:hypothetical protein